MEEVTTSGEMMTTLIVHPASSGQQDVGAHRIPTSSANLMAGVTTLPTSCQAGDAILGIGASSNKLMAGVTTLPTSCQPGDAILGIDALSGKLMAGGTTHPASGQHDPNILGMLTVPFTSSGTVETITRTENTVNLSQLKVLPVVMEPAVYERWRLFGSHQGLSSDSHIAAFLINHYETSHALSRCVNCSNMLPLYCSKCSHDLHTSLSLLPTSTTPPASSSSSSSIIHGHNGPSTTSLTSVAMATMREDEGCGGVSVGTERSPLEQTERKQSEGKSPRPTAAQKKGGKKKKASERGKPNTGTCGKCGTQLNKPSTQAATSAAKPKPSGSGGQPYRCSVCQSAFPYRQALQDHLFSRTAEGGYQCQHCQLVVLNGGDLRKHTLQHTQPMPYKCAHCPLAFSLACNLKTHLRTHSGEKPFSCRVCDRAFTQSIALKVHIRKHTGERPFPCPHCPMAFAASSNLSRHLLRHTGQKPYRCSYCSAAFSQPGSLKTHTRSKHTGERPYVCELCAAAFSDHSTLWKHKRNNTCLSGRVGGGGVSTRPSKPGLSPAVVPVSTSLSGPSFVQTALSTPPPPPPSSSTPFSGLGHTEDAVTETAGESGSDPGHQLRTISLAGLTVVGPQGLFPQHSAQLVQQPAPKMEAPSSNSPQPLQVLQQQLQQQQQQQEQQQQVQQTLVEVVGHPPPALVTPQGDVGHIACHTGWRRVVDRLPVVPQRSS